MKYKEGSDFNFLGEENEEKAAFVVDTSMVLAHYVNGYPRRLLGYDGNITTYNSDSCENLLQTLMTADGDTIHQFTSKNKNGLLYETTWTPFQPVKSQRVTTFYDYVFNEQGHWIQRKSRNADGVVKIDKRELRYY